jgi:hypothetical protein
MRPKAALEEKKGGTGIYKGTKLQKQEDHERSWETRGDTERYQLTELETQIQIHGNKKNTGRRDTLERHKNPAGFPKKVSIRSSEYSFEQ